MPEVGTLKRNKDQFGPQSWRPRVFRSIHIAEPQWRRNRKGKGARGREHVGWAEEEKEKRGGRQESELTP